MNGQNKGSHDFRRTKIHATIADINEQIDRQLSPNLIRQSYDSSDHYFKTQFHLLREESVRPLVTAVNQLKELLSEDKEDNTISKACDHNIQLKEDKHKKLMEEIDKNIETNVYFGIKLDRPHVVFDGNYGSVLKFTFDYKPIENIDLIDCQHLKNGGILCLSSDNFEKSIVFGLIVKSQLRETDQKTGERLWNFCLKLDFHNNGCKHFYEFLLYPKTTYIGVESPSFFEGFRYSLQILQNMSENFPMNRYIVEMAKNVRPPPYLTEDTTYNLSCIKKSEDSHQMENSVLDINPLASVELMKNDVYGDMEIYNKEVNHLKNFSTFDAKQFDAFYAALTKELSVIEGPPGTGKTFVGLKIVECLLNNIHVWTRGSVMRPILIVCYKNHALDQFLEGIIKFNSNVVRLGGNCESKELFDFKLGTIENQFREDLRIQNELKIQRSEQEDDNQAEDINGIKQLDPKLVSIYRKNNKIFFRIKSHYKSVNMLTKKIEQSFEKILGFKVLEPFIKPKSLAKQFSSEPNALYNWLNSDNDEKFDDICQKQLKKKRLSLEYFDEIPELVKTQLFDLNSNKKWLLYLYWREELFRQTEKQLKDIFQTMAEEFKKIKPKKIKFQRMLCKRAQVIGLTITGATKYADLVKAFNPQIMIVEEAAEVLEGHVVSAICSSIEHLILIGDHKQLRPLTNVKQLTDDYFLDISLFERLVKNDLPFVQLELQHRMRPCISQLLKVGKIYDNLRNDPKVSNYPNIDYTFGKNMFFLDHQNIEDANYCREVQDKSRSNLHEAKFVVELVRYFLLHNYPEDKITVLTTYNGQLSVIRKLMLEEKKIFVKEVEVENTLTSKIKTSTKLSQETSTVKLTPVEEQLRVRVSSVDGFQGEENNIIIISFVRSSKRNVIGFLGNKNRVNVALSRAKHALYCIGNFTIMANEEETKMWRNIIGHLAKQNCFGECLVLGCNCTGEQEISMPGQFALLNMQIKNGRCKCNKS